MRIVVTSFTVGLLVLLSRAEAGSKDVLVVVEPASDRWEVHGGFGIRQAFDFKVQSTSRNLLGGAYSAAAADSALYAGIGAADAEANRIYDDGFVNIGSDYNLTSYWGYASAAQVRQSSQAWDASQPWDSPGNQSLYLTRAGEAGVAGYAASAASSEELFPYLEARRWWDCPKDSFWHEKGLVASWSWIPASAGLAQELAVQRTVVVDEYYLYGVIPPAAPYSGPPLPPGPLLDNIPHWRELLNGSPTALATTRGAVDLDLNALSCGGIWRYAPDEQRDAGLHIEGLDLQAGLALNFARLKLRSTTTVTDAGELLGSFHDSASHSTVVPGIYLAVGATLDVGASDDWMIFTQGRFDYAGDVRVSTGLSSATVDLQGFAATIGIGRRW